MSAKTPRPWYRHHKQYGRWYVTLNGKQIPLPVTDPAAEADAWVTVKALLERALPAMPATRPGPCAAHVADYLASLASRANAKTIRSYGYCLKSFVAQFGSCAIAELTPDALELHASRQSWSDSHRHNWLWVCQAFVRWAGRRDFTLRRPAKESRGAEAVIDEATYRLILRETTGDFHELCRFLWCTGCRPQEAARLTAESIDWASGTATLKQHKTRHKGKRRILYLSSDALAILRAQADRHQIGFLFRGMGDEPFSPKAIVCRMLRVSAKIGRSVTAYGYRHSFATRALAAGIPDTHVSALLGHSSTRMLHEHYAHLIADARLLRETAEKISGITSGASDRI